MSLSKMIVWALFIIGHMGLFFYTKKGSIISTVDLPTTEIIEPFYVEGAFRGQNTGRKML